jgi:hypothetical protein
VYLHHPLALLLAKEGVKKSTVLDPILVAAATTSSSVVSSTPIFPFSLSLSVNVNPLSTLPPCRSISTLPFLLCTLSPGVCCHPRITKHSYLSKQGCPTKWSASEALPNCTNTAPACSTDLGPQALASRTDNVTVACLCAILQSGTNSRSSLPFSNRGTRRMNPQPLVDQRS